MRRIWVLLTAIAVVACGPSSAAPTPSPAPTTTSVLGAYLSAKPTPAPTRTSAATYASTPATAMEDVRDRSARAVVATTSGKWRKSGSGKAFNLCTVVWQAPARWTEIPSCADSRAGLMVVGAQAWFRSTAGGPWTRQDNWVGASEDIPLWAKSAFNNIYVTDYPTAVVDKQACGAGRTCVHVTVVNKYLFGATTEIWVDEQTWLPVKRTDTGSEITQLWEWWEWNVPNEIHPPA